MKRTIITFIISLLLLSASFSQDIYIVGGISASQLSLTYTDVPEFYDSFPVLSANVGLFYEARLNKTWALKLGVQANRQGKKMVGEPASGYYVDYKYLISYVETPLFISYYFKRASRRDLITNISIGPFWGYGYYGKYIETDNAFYSEENIFVGSDDLYRGNFGAILMVTTGFDNHRLSVYISPGIRNLGQEGGIFDNFRTLSAGVNYNLILHTNTKKSGFILRKLFYK